MQVIGGLTRPPDTVCELFTCHLCKRIAPNERVCSKCGSPTVRAGEVGIWKPRDTNTELDTLKKRIEELEAKK